MRLRALDWNTIETILQADRITGEHIISGTQINISTNQASHSGGFCHKTIAKYGVAKKRKNIAKNVCGINEAKVNLFVLINSFIKIPFLNDAKHQLMLLEQFMTFRSIHEYANCIFNSL